MQYNSQKATALRKKFNALRKFQSYKIPMLFSQAQGQQK